MIDVEAVRSWPFPLLRQTYTSRDTILYALSLGFGLDPADVSALRFVYESELVTMPTMAVVLCHPGFWIGDPATGIDAGKVVHGEQFCTFHRPLLPGSSVVGRVRVTQIQDKGRGKGALVVTERIISDAATGEPIATLEQRTLCRGDGGFEQDLEAGGGDRRASSARPSAADAGAAASIHSQLAGEASMAKSVTPKLDPAVVPDCVIDLPTSAQAALLYRQSADPNPLHVDPLVARAAGFARPILHGLCSYGIAARALVMTCCGGNPHALKSLGVRFSAPMFPGETLRTEAWRDGANVRFRCIALERNVVVMANGVAQVDVASATS